MTIAKYKGSISLTTVLVIGSMLMLSSLVLLVSSLDLLSSTKAYSDHKIAQINTNTCLEEAMVKIKANPGFTGTATITVNKGTCIYNVTNYQGNPAQKSIQLTGSLNGTIFKIVKLADTTKSPISISNLI